MQYSLRRIKSKDVIIWDQAFSLVEVLFTLAVIMVISAIGLSVFEGWSDSSEEAKLEQDVVTINQAVDMYYLSGGTIPADATPETVLSMLKRKATSSQANRIVGQRGSLLDSRVTPVMQTEADAAGSDARAKWNSTKKQFEVVRSGSVGVKKFVLGAATAAGEEVRKMSVEYAEVGKLIWDYDEGGTLNRPGFADLPVSTMTDEIPNNPISPSIFTLNAPEFSIAAGSYALLGFDLNVYITNPNPAGSSVLFTKIGSNPMEPYTGGPLIVPPNTSVTAYAVTNNPDYLDSGDSYQFYLAEPVTPLANISVPRNKFNYFEVGGARDDGNGGSTVSPSSVALALITNVADIPLRYQNDSVFNPVWTIDGSDPKTSGENLIPQASFCQWWARYWFQA